MTPSDIEYAEKRMKQKWYDLALAEQQGASLPILERLFNTYMLAVEEYNRCSESYLVEQQQARSTLPAVRTSQQLMCVSQGEERPKERRQRRKAS